MTRKTIRWRVKMLVLVLVLMLVLVDMARFSLLRRGGAFRTITAFVVAFDCDRLVTCFDVPVASINIFRVFSIYNKIE